MARLLVLAALAGLAVAEVAAVLALVDFLGPAPTVGVLALDMLLGILVMRWAVRGPAVGRGWRLTAGAFIALPGLVLDAVGAMLLIPAVQSWAQTRVMAGTQTVLRRQGLSVVTVTDPGGGQRTTVVTGDVIAGQVVDPDSANGADHSNPPASGPGQDGTPTVRGELAGPDE
jgi:UPF0716 family protein affecting phage T7 exclusion